MMDACLGGIAEQDKSQLLGGILKNSVVVLMLDLCLSPSHCNLIIKVDTIVMFFIQFKKLYGRVYCQYISAFNLWTNLRPQLSRERALTELEDPTEKGEGESEPEIQVALLHRHTWYRTLEVS